MAESWPVSPVDYSVFSAASSDESFTTPSSPPISLYADPVPVHAAVLRTPLRSPSTNPFCAESLPFVASTPASLSSPAAAARSDIATPAAIANAAVTACSSSPRSSESTPSSPSQTTDHISPSDSSESSDSMSSFSLVSPSPASPSASSSLVTYRQAASAIVGGKRRRTRSAWEEERKREEQQLLDEREKKHRWAVIAATTNRMKELYDEIAAWKEGYRRQQQHAQQLAGDLQAATAALCAAVQQQRLYPAAGSQSVEHSRESSSALDRAMGSMVFGSPLAGTSLLAVGLFDVTSGRIHDCNTRFMDGMPLTRDQLIGVRLIKSYDDLMMDDHTWAAEQPALEPSADFVKRAERKHEKQQYPESMEQMRQLWRGEVERIDVVIRCHIAMYEVRSSFWVAEWADVDDGQGDSVRRPQRMLAIASLADAKPVE